MDLDLDLEMDLLGDSRLPLFANFMPGPAATEASRLAFYRELRGGRFDARGFIVVVVVAPSLGLASSTTIFVPASLAPFIAVSALPVALVVVNSTNA